MSPLKTKYEGSGDTPNGYAILKPEFECFIKVIQFLMEEYAAIAPIIDLILARI